MKGNKETGKSTGTEKSDKGVVVDLHNHTARCNHAEGTLDDYIRRAVEKEIDIFGFSDHAPMDFDPRYRMGFEEMRAYEADVKRAREKYAGTIDIRLAYEVDYLPGHIDERVLEADVDYLIGSVHFIDKWGFDNPEFIGKYEGADIDGIWRDYFELVEKMATEGKFDIVGHLDLIKVFKYVPKTDVRLIAQNAMDAIKRSGMAIEINAAGYRKPIGEPYPSRELLVMAYERGIPITFGSDAHKPEQVGYKKEEIAAFARSVGYTEAVHYIKRERSTVRF